MLTMKEVVEERGKEGGCGDGKCKTGLRHSKDSESVCASAPELPGIFLALPAILLLS